jgi:hypothetical protein
MRYWLCGSFIVFCDSRTQGHFAPEFGEVGTLTIDGEPWFVGKDVAEVLGYTDTAQAIRKHVDPEDKGVVEMTTPGGIQAITTINESGLYSLVLSSKLPGAQRIRRAVLMLQHRVNILNARVDVLYIYLYIDKTPARFSATPWGVGLSRADTCYLILAAARRGS